MKKIKFRLEKLLDIRMKEEEESEHKYMQAQKRRKVLEDRLEDLRSSYDRYSDISNLEDIITQKITINYLDSLSQSIKSTSTQIEKEVINVKSAKNDLVDKQIKRKSLEQLKEDKLTKLRKEKERKEQITNDEFALYAYMRSKSEIV